MSLPQAHLASVFAESGTGDATAAVRALLEIGMAKLLEKEKAERAAQGKDVREYAYVSEAGKCPRQLFFAFTGVPKSESLTLDQWMTFRIGKLAEQAYIELLEAAGVTILSQERVELESDGEKVVGKLDLLLEIPAEIRERVPGLDARELWELKTKNSRALGWMLKRGGPDAEDGYVRQVRAYLHAGANGQIPAPTQARGRLVYTAVGATKGEPLFHAWFVPYEASLAASDLSTLAHAMKGARAGVDPGIPEAYRERPNWPCGYCDWKRHCHFGRSA